MITVVDYKAGNLASVIKAFAALGFATEVTDQPEVVARAKRLVLPGVGHFAATGRLIETGLHTALLKRVNEGAPFLGICVGLQWLFEGSTEAPGVTGAGLARGTCERFSAAGFKVPHVGWNSLEVEPGAALMRGVEQGAFAYFTHSYRAPMVSGTVAVTNYAGLFTAAYERGNVMGVQFHPEKSGNTGLRVLKNFAEWKGC